VSPPVKLRCQRRLLDERRLGKNLACPAGKLVKDLQSQSFELSTIGVVAVSLRSWM